ncbi:hypothetical protein RIF29_42069 [Crotalaria pallida]|uniref:Uncharacterized protein n=1 Tax=Crotalaria pallida TaxID=3830 RepID=A0AAN9EC89_CROPI
MAGQISFGKTRRVHVRVFYFSLPKEICSLIPNSTFITIPDQKKTSKLCSTKGSKFNQSTERRKVAMEYVFIAYSSFRKRTEDTQKGMERYYAFRME